MKKILSLLVCVCVLLSAMVITASAADTEIVFDFGANKASGTAHADGNDIGSSKSYTVDGYTLALTGVEKCYDGANDATGISALKLGTSKLIGKFSFTVPADVTSVIFKVAQYKANTTKIAINGTNHTITTSSNNGAYTPITVDTTSTKTITFATVASNYRCMIDSITYIIAETTGGDDTACTHAATSTEANGNETHKVVCDDCGETVDAAVDCADADVNGKCDVCAGDVAIPVQDPAADSTLTIADAIALGASKDHNVYTAGKYYVTGVITEVYQTTYGNMKLTDDNGNILTVYGTYSADGKTRYDALDVKPVAGDTVTVYGIVGQYNGTPQVKDGWITAHTPATTPDPDPTPDPETPVAGNVELTVDSLGLPSDSYNAEEATGTVNGVNFSWIQLGNYGAGIQVRDKDGKTSSFWNTTAFSAPIKEIRLVFNATKSTYDNADAEIFSFGNEAGTYTYSTKLSTVAGTSEYVITPDAETYTYLHFEHDLSYSMYWDSITIVLAEADDDTNDDNTNNDDTNNDNTNNDANDGAEEKPEVKPEGDNSTTSPATGDNMGAVAMVAIAAAAVLVASKKR